MSNKRTRRTAVGLLAGAAALAATRRTARAQATKVRCLIAAPAILPAFTPFQLALGRGYYRAENLDVELVTVNGGAEVAKQVGANNAEVGVSIGDATIILRANGVPVRGVALLGGRSLMKVVWRNDRGISSIKDLKGKNVAVLSYSDITYYSFLGVLSKVGLTKNDVNIVAVGPAGVTQTVIAGSADALAAVPEWAVQIEAAGVPLTLVSADRYFPSMAQAVVASDETIKTKPAIVRGFVRGTLRAIRDIMSDVDKVLPDYLNFVPQNKGQEANVKKTLQSYDEQVYPGQRRLGEWDPRRLGAVEQFYIAGGIVEKAVPVDQLYTNEFVR